MSASAIQPLLKSLPEGAEALGISVPTLRRLIDRGEIATVHIGARIMIAIEELRRVATEGAGVARSRKAR